MKGEDIKDKGGRMEPEEMIRKKSQGQRGMR
jgi:hypothetical protein